jgi:hypothetical protein
MSKPLSRRDAMKRLVVLCGAAGALREIRPAAAAEAEHLSPSDPTAAALKYIPDAKTVDAKQYPSYQPGQSCGTCLQLQAGTDPTWRPCNLFPGKLVNVNGWCQVWVKKS